MAGALAQHAVEPQADEQGDQREDDDRGQRCPSSNPSDNRATPNISADSALDFKRRARSCRRAIAPLAARLLGARHASMPRQRRLPRSISTREFTRTIMAEPGQRRPTRDGSAERRRTRRRRSRDRAICQGSCRSRIPNAPQVFQWQGQPQIDVQFNINVDRSRRRRPRSRAEDRRLGAVRTRARTSSST